MNPLRSFDRRRGNAQGVVSVSICGLVVEVRINHRVKLADPQVCIEAAAPPRRAPSAATLAAGGTGHRQGAPTSIRTWRAVSGSSRRRKIPARKRSSSRLSRCCFGTVAHRRSPSRRRRHRVVFGFFWTARAASVAASAARGCRPLVGRRHYWPTFVPRCRPLAWVGDFQQFQPPTRTLRRRFARR